MRLGDTLERLQAEIDPRHLKSLGLGAINAISRHVFRLAGYPGVAAVLGQGR